MIDTRDHARAYDTTDSAAYCNMPTAVARRWGWAHRHEPLCRPVCCAAAGWSPRPQCPAPTASTCFHPAQDMCAHRTGTPKSQRVRVMSLTEGDPSVRFRGVGSAAQGSASHSKTCERMVSRAATTDGWSRGVLGCVHA